MPDFRQDNAGWQRHWAFPWASTSLLLSVSLGSSSCLFQKKPPRAFQPPPVAARIPPDNRPVVLPAPPETSTEVAPGEEIAVTNDPTPLPAPPKPIAPVVVVTPPSNPPAQAPNPGVSPTPPAAPKPVQVYTAQERQALVRELEDSLGRVQQALARVENRRLNADQQSIVNRIKTFQQQALQERNQDLVAAVSLAKRADSLARDLLGRLP